MANANPAQTTQVTEVVYEVVREKSGIKTTTSYRHTLQQASDSGVIELTKDGFVRRFLRDGVNLVVPTRYTVEDVLSPELLIEMEATKAGSTKKIPVPAVVEEPTTKTLDVSFDA